VQNLKINGVTVAKDRVAGDLVFTADLDRSRVRRS